MDVDYWTATIARALSEAGFLEAEAWGRLRSHLPGWERWVLRPQIALTEAPPGNEGALRDALRQAEASLFKLGDLLSLATELSTDKERAPLEALRTRMLRDGSATILDAPPEALPVTADTRPLEDRLLLDFQRDVLEHIEGWLASLRGRGQKEQPAKPKWPLPEIESDRTHQAVLIDGERGTGKTALLLTLVQKWNRQVQSGQPADYLPIALLDYDPMPPDLGVYPWLVSAFQRWAEALDEPSEIKDWRGGKDSPTLRQSWNEVYRKALLGWSNRAEVMTESREQRVADRKEADGAWQGLRRAWTTFLDEVVTAAERRQVLARGGLLILGVDDLDLNDHYAGQLLVGLRLLQHPRLAVVLTGDRDHLERVLIRELWLEGSAQGRVSKDMVQDVSNDARQLARALIKKTLPQIRGVRRLRLLEVLRMAAARWRDVPVLDLAEPDLVAWLQEARAPQGSLGFEWGQSLATWLSDPERVPGEPVFTIRSVVHALGLENVRPGVPGQMLRPEQQLQRLMRAATSPDGVPLLEDETRHIEKLAVRRDRRGHLYLAVTLKGESELRENELIEFGIRAGILRVGVERWEKRPNSPVVFSEIETERPRRAQLGWPTLERRLQLAEALAEDERTGSRLRSADAQERLRAWIEVHLHPAWDTIYWSAPPTSASLAVLLDEAAADARLMPWVRDDLPVLVAPEYGLEKDAVRVLLAVSLRLCGEASIEWSEQIKQLNARRQEATKEALTNAGSTLNRLPSGHPARQDAPWEEQALNLPWYSWQPKSGGKTAAEIIEQTYNPRLDELPSRMALLAHNMSASGSYDWHPHWASRVLSDDAAWGGLVGRAFQEVYRQNRKNAGLRLFVAAWRELYRIHSVILHKPETWFEVAESGEGLTYRGPALTLKARLSAPLRTDHLVARTVETWQVVHDSNLLNWPDAMVGWLGIMQSLLVLAPDGSAYAKHMIEVEEPELLRPTRREPLVKVGSWSWLRADLAADSWKAGFEQANDLSASEPGLSIERYLFAWWCYARSRSWGRHTQVQPPDYPLSPDRLRHVAWSLWQDNHSLVHRVWRDGEDFEVLLDEEARRAWRRGFSASPNREPVPAEKLINHLKAFDRYNLRLIVQHAALAVERRLADEANPVRSLADLHSVHGMDAWTISCLNLWANTVNL